MNLNKFFNKYATPLLIGFMSLLLVAFLLPPSMFRGSQGGGSFVVGEAFGQPVTSADLNRTDLIISLAQGFGLLPGNIDRLDAHLLIMEAKAAGVHVGPEAMKERLAQQPGLEQVMATLRERYGVSYEQIYQYLGEWASVTNMLRYQVGASSPSRPRQIISFRDQAQQADVRCSVILAQDLVRHVGEPTEADLQALYEAGRDRDTEHTDTELVYGYRQPARLKLEYLTVDPQKIRDLVRIRDLEAEAYYEDNRDQFMSEPGTPGEGPTLEPRQLTYDEAERQVKNALRPAKAIKEAQSLVNLLHTEARGPWIGAELTDDRFKVAPPADQQISFEALKEKFEAKQDYPIEYKSVDFSSQSDLANLTGFGQARIRSGGVMLTAPEYAMRVQGLFTPAEGDSGLFLTLNEPSEVVVLSRYNPTTRGYDPTQAYMFRVTAVKPAGPPESLDEVRDTVVSNWKTIQAYALAEQFANELYATAQTTVLTTAAAEASDLRDQLRYPPLNADDPNKPEVPDPRSTVALGNLGPNKAATFTRDYQRIRGVPSGSPELAKKVFAIENPLDTPLAERTFIVGNTTNQAWIVAQVEDIDPIYEDNFDKQRGQFGRLEFQMVRQLWLDSDAIHTRTGWKPKTSKEDS